MRRASTCLAVLGLAALAVPAAASATPTVTLSTKAVKIPGFPKTGNCLGCGLALEVHTKISGTEGPGGVPFPLTHVNFYLPKGTKLHPGGFVTCKPEVLENTGPSGCPKKSQASPVGSAAVAQRIGQETVHEEATLQAFFAPGGGLQFYTNAASPISAQLIAATGKYVSASGIFAYKFESEVKLITSLPGAPPVSTESFNLKVGAAYKQGKNVISYGTAPKKCPKPHGSFPLKEELTFQNGETVTSTYNEKCPPH